MEGLGVLIQEREIMLVLKRTMPTGDKVEVFQHGRLISLWWERADGKRFLLTDNRDSISGEVPPQEEDTPPLRTSDFLEEG